MGRRRNIWELSAGERASLKAAVKAYAESPGVVEWHKANHALHTSGYYFLAGHRHYIEGLEAFLRAGGQLGPDELLPVWDPSERQRARRAIPPEFIDPATGEGHIHDIWRPLRPLVAFSFFPFKGFWLRLWPPFPFPHPSFVPWTSLYGIVLCWTAHFLVHVLVGGLFAQIPRTSETPLFWLWHAFIDDLYFDWQQAREHSSHSHSTHAHASHPHPSHTH